MALVTVDVLTKREAAPQAVTKKATRLTSLDAFRGATVALMLLVNNLALGEATPAQFIHAPFGDWARIADLVFPWFLLCAGLSMPLSFRSAQRRGMTYGSWCYKSAGRMFALLALGMFLDSSIMKVPVFGLGVLQLIGMASFVAAVLAPAPIWVRATVASALLAGYGAALAWIPLPTHGRPVLSEEVNLVRYLNDAFLQPIGFRGLVSVIPTAALVIFGSLIGEQIVARNLGRILLIGAGLAGLGAGWFLMGHPMSKEIWTSPYILFAGGLGSMVIAALAWILDGRRAAVLAAPFLVFGSNALLAYAAPILIKCLILRVWTVGDVTLQDAWLNLNVAKFGKIGGGWLYTLEYMGLVWLGLAWLRRKGLILRV